MKTLFHTLLMLFIGFSSFSSAGSEDTGTLATSETITQEKCKTSLTTITVDSVVAEAMLPVKTVIEESRQHLCEAIYEPNNLDRIKYEKTIRYLAENLPTAVDSYFNTLIKLESVEKMETKDLLTAPINTYTAQLKLTPFMPLLDAYSRQFTMEDTYVFGFGSSSALRAKVNAPQCDQLINPNNTIPDLHCGMALKELRRVINYLNEPQEDKAYITARNDIQKTLDKWDRFNRNARAMTFLDSIATYQLQKGYYSQVGQDGPSDWQFFLLHPVALIEHIPDATRGDKTEFSLGIELFGVNCWDCFDGSFPIGASVAVIHADRHDVSELGAGLSLHLFNDFTIGYTYRDEGSGFYIDLNLTEWLTNKKDHYERGVQKLKDEHVIPQDFDWL